MTTESFKTWRARVEMRLAHAFEAGGISYWNARDAALNIVDRAKGLRALYNRGADPATVAASLNKMKPATDPRRARRDPSRQPGMHTKKRTDPARLKPSRVVVYEGAPGRPWKADVFDDSGFKRSSTSITGTSPRHHTREYVERWVADFFPGLPVEFRKSGAAKTDPARHAHFRSIRRHTQPKRTGGLRVRTITNVLGQSRKVRAYPDGSFHCPFCGYGAHRGVCENPGCSAARYKGSSGWRYMQTPDSVRKARAASEARRAEEERRKQAHESAMRRGEEHRASQMTKMQETLAEAKKRGACTHRGCLNLSGYGPVKYVKHRGECPNKREEEWKRGQRR